ncbi:MAG: leucine-rich repeat domain-containing protein [Thermoguttaceae bacterium]
MWLVRLLRHRPMLICLFGHAALVAVWAFVVWSAELTEWSILCLIGCLLTPVVFFLDLPVFLLASWYSSKSIIGDVFSVNGDFFQFTLYVLLCGSVQWGLIGLFLAVWDLRRHRRKFQYSLRTLMLVMFMACIGMSWVSVRIQRARQQKEAVEAILEMGGRVWYDFFGTAFVVECNSSQMTDDGLQDLKELTQLKRLTLGDTKVTDAGLEALEGLTQLQVLWLDGTQITDAGLEHLEGLTQLKRLRLDRTQITDAGLEHLNGLTQLQESILWHTKVTHEGVKRLQQALPNCQIRR